MKKAINYTAKVELSNYNRGEFTNVIRVDSFNDMHFVCENDPLCKSVRNYVVGPAVDRLYEFESLGYEPDEILEIIKLNKVYRHEFNSVYGKRGEQKSGSDQFNLQLLLYEALKNPDKAINISLVDGSPMISITPWPKEEEEND